MKFFLLLFAFHVLNNHSFANVDEYIRKLSKIIEKSELCLYAVTDAPKRQFSESNFLYPKSVRCLGDITVGPGTLKEATGCAAFYLSVETLRFSPFTKFTAKSEDSLNIVKNKTCENGGAEELLSKKMLYGIPIINKFSRIDSSNDMFELRVVYESPKLPGKIKSIIEERTKSITAKKRDSEEKEKLEAASLNKKNLEENKKLELQKKAQKIKESKSKALYE